MPAFHWCCSLAEPPCWSVDVSQSFMAGYASWLLLRQQVLPHSPDIISLMAYSRPLMWQTVPIWELFACCVYCFLSDSPAGGLILVPFGLERDISSRQGQRPSVRGRSGADYKGCQQTPDLQPKTRYLYKHGDAIPAQPNPRAALPPNTTEPLITPPTSPTPPNPIQTSPPKPTGPTLRTAHD